jgi:hypothetical protein
MGMPNRVAGGGGGPPSLLEASEELDMNTARTRFSCLFFVRLGSPKPQTFLKLDMGPGVEGWGPAFPFGGTTVRLDYAVNR